MQRVSSQKINIPGGGLLNPKWQNNILRITFFQYLLREKHCKDKKGSVDDKNL